MIYGWRGGRFLSEKIIQHSQSYKSSIDNDVFSHELKALALIIKIEPQSFS